MSELVLWTGPVSKSQVDGATVEGAKELYLGCRGDQGSWAWCPGLGQALRPAPSLLAARAGAPSLEAIYMGAFSAGGSLLKRLLEEEPYRELTAAVHLADATYTSQWVDASSRIPPAIEGFVRYGVDVAQGPGDKLFIATASPTPNKNWASGVENLLAIEKEIERRTGLKFVERDDLFGIGPTAERVSQLGNVVFGYYPGSPLGHAGHTKLAGPLWEQVIQPWVSRGRGPIDGSGPAPPPPAPPLPPAPPSDPYFGCCSPLQVVLATTLGAAVGYAVARAIVT